MASQDPIWLLEDESMPQAPLAVPFEEVTTRDKKNYRPRMACHQCRDRKVKVCIFLA